MFDTAKPYIACYLILRDGDKIAFVLRGEATKWMAGYYGLPSGKVEKNESFSQGVIREGLEEVGVSVLPENIHHTHTMHRHDEVDWVDVYFEAPKWKGEITNAEPHVHEEVAWLNVNDLPENVVPPVRAALEAIEKGEKYSEYGWN
ncbi:MAG: NUDIX domain-containing protein [Candidatus Saccharibacteria bacterium]|nr:NUDIX domain-containing protein [Candidatus Saccharibacteria bacterium]